MERYKEKYFAEKCLNLSDKLPIENVKLYGVIEGVSTERKAHMNEIHKKYFLDVSLSLAQEQENNIGGCSEQVKIKLPVDKDTYDKINSVYNSNNNQNRTVMIGNLELLCASSVNKIQFR
ncbi:MAG: hypothetical protein ACP5OG_04405 [Candidatus Nanoarchaeia archaeon]